MALKHYLFNEQSMICLDALSQYNTKITVAKSDSKMIEKVRTTYVNRII